MDMMLRCLKNAIDKIVISYAILALIFYGSTIAGSAFQVTIHRSVSKALITANCQLVSHYVHFAGQPFLIMSIIMMIFCGLCIASSVLLIIGTFVDGKFLLVPWMICIGLTNVYSITFSILTRNSSEYILADISLDIAFAILFSLGVLFVLFKYSMTSSLDNVHCNNSSAKISSSFLPRVEGCELQSIPSTDNTGFRDTPSDITVEEVLIEHNLRILSREPEVHFEAIYARSQHYI
ncbi:hypothetical protein HDE_01758 [Halotydeus destructor]|nr:hypothetical protein HDE_01758 [Halotydeus destructor]